jgi:hypothetical protein
MDQKYEADATHNFGRLDDWGWCGFGGGISDGGNSLDGLGLNGVRHYEIEML